MQVVANIALKYTSCNELLHAERDDRLFLTNMCSVFNNLRVFYQNFRDFLTKIEKFGNVKRAE